MHLVSSAISLYHCLYAHRLARDMSRYNPRYIKCFDEQTDGMKLKVYTMPTKLAKVK